MLLIKSEKGWEFSHRAEIRETDISEPSETDGYRICKIVIFHIESLKTPYTLDDYAYSLIKVYKHFDNPIIHFQQKYFRIYDQDFETISTGNIFLARTAFGKILNALPIEHINNFLSFYLDGDISRAFGGVDYVEGFRKLKVYVDHNIISHVTMLYESHDLMYNLAPSEHRTIGFEAENGITDTIADQVKLSRNQKLQSALLEENNSNGILSAIEKNMGGEKKLINSFSKYPIPLTKSK